MRCNPWRWLWGLIPLAMLSWVALHLNQHNIESDLKVRTTEALERAGLGWASTSFDGRDAVLTGRASDEGDPKKAAELTRRVWGVRVVDARTDLIEKVDKYVWSAQRSDAKRLRLSGFVPGEQTRRAVMNAAKASFPDHRIEDAMQLARGAPDREVFLGGIGFGLKQLAALKHGSIELSNTDFSIAGEAGDQASLKAVRAQLSSALPKGIRLANDRITGPVIAPYVWSAKLTGNQVVLSGYVPSSQVRDQLYTEARKLFPRHAVIDRLEIGSGEPQGFGTAAAASLQHLYQLKEGSVELKSQSIVLEGLAEDEAAAAAVRRAFTSKIARPLTATANIRAPSPAVPAATPEPAPQAQPTGPYTTSARFEGGVIELTGSVPSNEERVALLAAVRGRFPNTTVNDRLEVRSGAPRGWQSCLLAGLSGLPKLQSGAVRLTGLTVDVSGRTDDDDIASAAARAVTAAASTGCSTTMRIESSGSVQAAARQREADEAARRAAEAAARSKAEEAARRAAAEADARRKAEEEARLAARRAEAQKCEQLMADATAAGTILFKRADATLDAKSRPTLNRLVEIVNACPGLKILVEGHTDAEGIPERNQPLSERRAAAVVDYLVEAGVDSGRLDSAGYGAERPIADNETAAGRAKNRRIEFRVTAE